MRIKYLILLPLLGIFLISNNVYASYEESLKLFQEGKNAESLKMIADELDVKLDLVDGSPNYKLRYLAAHNHWKMKNYTNALIHLTRCSDIKPKAVDPLIDRSLILLDINRTKEVLSLARKILIIDDKNAAAYYLLGEVKLRWRSYWGAKQFFEKALSLDPELYRGWNSLGIVFMNLKMFSKANTAFSMSLAIKPGDSSVLSNLALSLLKLEKKQEALDTIEKAYELDEKNELIAKNLEKIKLIINK